MSASDESNNVDKLSVTNCRQRTVGDELSFAELSNVPSVFQVFAIESTDRLSNLRWLKYAKVFLNVLSVCQRFNFKRKMFSDFAFLQQSTKFTFLIFDLNNYVSTCIRALVFKGPPLILGKNWKITKV